MCGIAGYLNTNGQRIEHTATIIEMIGIQQHRGPDDSGIRLFSLSGAAGREYDHRRPEPVDVAFEGAFGFNRLSILDLSANGHQPMCSADGKVCVIFNGEIYNAFDYRDELLAKGYIFRGTSDTEVLLNLYLEYGFDTMIGMLNGMFAFALFDLRDGRLFLARDRFGIKPLYVLRQTGRLAFASELKSFRALPGFRFEFDSEYLDEFLLFRNLINRTLFKNIYNLTPGTYLYIDAQGQERTVAYYDMETEGQAVFGTKDAQAQLDRSLGASVKRQLMSDVKLGCQLSGGVDSSLVSYYAAQEVESGQLETISIVFNEPAFSEEKYVDIAAAQLQLRAHKFLLDARYYIDQIEPATWHFEQPLNHPNTIGIYLLSQEARKYVTVLLSGEGADETLAGYGRFADVKRNPWVSRHFFSKLKQNKSEALHFLNYFSNPDLRMIMASVFGSLTVIKKLRPGFAFSEAVGFRRELAGRIEGEQLLRYRKYELQTYLPDLLMRQDKMSMAHSIENRVPFLDNEMVTTALNTPADALVNTHAGRLENKLALKKLCAAKFSPDFAFRDKMGFGIPLKAFMQSTTFQEKLRDQWLPGIRQRGIFADAPVGDWADGIASATVDQLEGLWLMVGFETWARQYLDA